MSISTDVLETGGFDQLASPVPFAALSLVIVTAIWSTYYLNKAMILFKNSEVGMPDPRHCLDAPMLPSGAPRAQHDCAPSSQVVPVYFTSFTLASIGAGALVYRWALSSPVLA